MQVNRYSELYGGRIIKIFLKSMRCSHSDYHPLLLQCLLLCAKQNKHNYKSAIHV